MNAKINTKRKRVKFASDNVTGACPEVLDAIIKANDGIAPPYGNDEISGVLQEKFSKICLLYTSPSPRDGLLSRMPSSA